MDWLLFVFWLTPPTSGQVTGFGWTSFNVNSYGLRKISLAECCNSVKCKLFSGSGSISETVKIFSSWSQAPSPKVNLGIARSMFSVKVNAGKDPNFLSSWEQRIFVQHLFIWKRWRKYLILSSLPTKMHWEQSSRFWVPCSLHLYPRATDQNQTSQRPDPPAPV